MILGSTNIMLYLDIYLEKKNTIRARSKSDQGIDLLIYNPCLLFIYNFC